MEYRPSEIEAKWKQYWDAHNTYRVENGGTKPKFYILNMFPYPSGAGLHVGHPLGYIATDIFARYKRLKGFNVLNPMGYDSFGLPAEQYAIQTGTHPAVTTEKNINTFRSQLNNLGFSFDWSREVRTSEPSYYKWTQWIFMQLFNHYYDRTADKALPISDLVATLAAHGNATINAVCDEDTPSVSADDWNAMSETAQQLFLLKYRLTFPDETFVNWCPALGTVLSNDEVKDGVSERGGHPVERKLMKQWSMRITAYADKLLNGLNEIEWSDSLKEQQRNWIGRSQGASVKFALETDPSLNIEVFTTRVDTIFGVTFMVLAPEHELVAAITTAKQRKEIENYQRWAAARSDVDRQAEKKVSGAFTGAFCINPFNAERVPIYIADYVLAGYGTGAVMAVPSGDQRDWNFATHFKLPIVPILDAQQNVETQADNTKEGRYINSGFINGMSYAEAVPALIQWLEERGLGKGKVQYRLRNAIFSRQRYWGEPVPVYYKNGVPYLIEESELPLLLPSIEKYLPTETGEPPLARAKGWKYKGQYDYEHSTMPGWAGSSWYFYRYMDAQNDGAFAAKDALDYWRQVDLYVGGTEHAVGHLLYSRFWNHFLYDLGLVPEKEYAKKLVNQGMIQGRSNFVFRAKEGFFEEYLWLKVLKPFLSDWKPRQMAKSSLQEALTYDFSFDTNDLAIEVTSYKNLDKIERKIGIAHSDDKRLLVLTNEELMSDINNPEIIAEKIKAAITSKDGYILNKEKPAFEQLFVSHDLTQKYSKDAFTKLHVDVNIVENDVLNLEKAKASYAFKNSNFKVNTEGAFTCSWEVEKMSKGKFNVVNPDDMVAQYGADCFRMYEMFLGPLEDAKPWSTLGINGVSGFLRKLWSLFYEPMTGKSMLTDGEPTRDELRVLHTCIKKINDDIERFSFNTCVSHFMICVNGLKELKCSKRLILNELVVMLAPFAPFTAEELWETLGNTPSVLNAHFPIQNEDYLKLDEILYPISINGKKRGEQTFAADASAADIETAVRAMEVVKKWTEGEGKPIKKVIVVAGRMVNIVA
jgi:leucyl-tRNA synthetase